VINELLRPGKEAAEIGWKNGENLPLFWSGELPLFQLVSMEMVVFRAVHRISRAGVCHVDVVVEEWCLDQATIVYVFAIIRLELSLLSERTVMRKGLRFC
jgi:hypothetical protein